MIKNDSLSYNFYALNLKKLNVNAVLPTAANEGDVGYDLFSAEEYELQPGRVTRCSTGLALAEAPEPLIINRKIIATPYIKIESRSGYAGKGVFVVGGIIDNCYRGDIQVALFNSSPDVVKITSQKAMAQFVIYYVLASVGSNLVVKFLEVDNISATDRGDKGFGSSDVEKEKDKRGECWLKGRY